MSEREKEMEHRIRRMIARAKWEEHVYRSEMICQKISGAIWTILLIGCWKILDEIEYGLFFLPCIAGTVMMILTDTNMKREV